MVAVALAPLKKPRWGSRFHIRVNVALQLAVC
jgi:hypothetical protein